MRLKFPIHSNHVLCDGRVFRGGEGYTKGPIELSIREIIDQQELLDCLHRVPLAFSGSHESDRVVKRMPKVCSRAAMPVVAEVRDYLARRYPKPSIDPVCLEYTYKNASLTRTRLRNGPQRL